MEDGDIETFWGVELAAGGKHVPFVPPPQEAKLHISQACMTPGSKSGAKAYVRCQVQDCPPLVIAALREGHTEHSSIDLVFDSYTEFWVEGDAAVHLTGYHMPMEDEVGPGEYGEEYEDEDEEDKEYTPQEIEALKKMIKQQQKGELPDGLGGDDSDEDDSEEQDDSDLDNNVYGIKRLDSDDEEGSDEETNSDEFETDDEDESEDEEGGTTTIAAATKSTVVIEEIEVDPKDDLAVEAATKKRKADAAALERPAASKKAAVAALPQDKAGQKSAQKAAKAAAAAATAATPSSKIDGKAAKKAATPAAATPGANGKAAAAQAAATPTTAGKAGKQKGAATQQQTPSTAATTPANGAAPASQSKGGRKGVRRFPNGLEIADTAMGEPDGKMAKAGKRVKMRYVGRLASNNKIFDQTKGKPFSFRLGVGEVIAGWDKGIEGMRVGDKRRLTIPPSMGYGGSGAPPDIPGNATLVFDVELVNVM